MTTKKVLREEERHKQKEAVTTTITFEREVYKRLRYLAVDRDSDVRAIVRQAIHEYLEKHGGGR